MEHRGPLFLGSAKKRDLVSQLIIQVRRVVLLMLAMLKTPCVQPGSPSQGKSLPGLAEDLREIRVEDGFEGVVVVVQSDL